MATISTKYLTPIRKLLDQDIRTIISGKLQLDPSDIPGEVGLGELGFDSLALSDLAETIEERFAVQVPNRMLPATLTIDQLVSLIVQKQEAVEGAANNDTVAEGAA